MKLVAISPCYNESGNLSSLFESMLAQSNPPDKWIIVDDQSTDDTWKELLELSSEIPWIDVYQHTGKKDGISSEKIVRAFNFGLSKVVVDDYDIITKIDSDLIFPSNYFEEARNAFLKDTKLGIFGGVVTVIIGGKEVLDSYTNKDHIRGAIKSYSRNCFKDIEGLSPYLGWDSMDEYKAEYLGWKILVNENLKVLQIRETASNVGLIYATRMAGETMYQFRYGFFITCVGTLKKIKEKPYLILSIVYIFGYFKAALSFKKRHASKELGKFIRSKVRKGIRKKAL